MGMDRPGGDSHRQGRVQRLMSRWQERSDRFFHLHEETDPPDEVVADPTGVAVAGSLMLAIAPGGTISVPIKGTVTVHPEPLLVEDQEAGD
jgi:hypothetical protein